MNRPRERPDGSALPTDPIYASGHKCPRCAAPRGTCCSTPSGLNTHMHAERIRLAERAEKSATRNASTANDPIELPCRRCKSPPGVPCATPSGTYTGYHSSRLDDLDKI